MKLKFGDKESIKKEKRIIYESIFVDNGKSDDIEKIIAHMKNETKKCGCVDKNFGRILRFNAKLKRINEAEQRLFWVVECCYFHHGCLFVSDNNEKNFLNTCFCYKNVVTNLEGKIIEKEQLVENQLSLNL